MIIDRHYLRILQEALDSLADWQRARLTVWCACRQISKHADGDGGMALC